MSQGRVTFDLCFKCACVNVGKEAQDGMEFLKVETQGTKVRKWRSMRPLLKTVESIGLPEGEFSTLDLHSTVCLSLCNSASSMSLFITFLNLISIGFPTC